MRLIRNLFRRRPRRRVYYAVIYDSWDYDAQEWVDNMYEAFLSPEEAIDMFTTAYGNFPQEVANPRVVQILNPLPGKWGDISTPLETEADE